MNFHTKRLEEEFKKLIHILSNGKRTPTKYGDFELYRAEIHILEIIGESESIAATDIAKKLDVTKGAISQIIAKLSSKGLITKSKGTKIHQLSVTQRGEQTLKVHSKHEEVLLFEINKKLEDLTPESIETFCEILNTVSTYIKTREQDRNNHAQN